MLDRTPVAVSEDARTIFNSIQFNFYLHFYKNIYIIYSKVGIH